MKIVGSKVLVVDDDPMFLLMLSQFLEKEGYCVIQAENGEAAVASFQQFQPNCVLMDVMMPVMDGFEACRRIRALAENESTPVILMTAQEQDEAVDCCYEAGASDYISKPIHWAALRNRVRNFIEKSTADRKIIENERRFSQIFRATGDTFWLTDAADKELLFVNESYERIFSQSKDMLQKNPLIWIDCIHPEDRNDIQALLDQYQRRDIDSFENTFRIDTDNGKIRWLNIHCFPVHGSGKGDVWKASVARDITSHQRLEEQVHQTQKMEAIGTLVGGIAHDFNNMLAGMTGNLYLAKKYARELSNVVQKLANVEQLSFRAAEMIQQLLTFASKSMVSMKPTPIIPFIKETLKLLRTSLPENIELHQDICSDALIINGDSTQLDQLLLNLINNARDAVEGVDHPVITTRLELFHADEAFIASHAYFEDKPYAHLSVQDNGIGIPEDQIEHLFEPFFTTKEQGKGTGLGLSMVYGAIKTHHGLVEVDSVEGEGSTFHVYIPLIQGKEVAVTPAQEKETTTGRGELILLVDDEQQVVDTGQEVLESLGYRVLTASNGHEAVDLFQQHADEIDLCIFDVVMPVMSGDEAARFIRQIKPQIKIIFSTGYDRSLLDGIEHETVLSKPFSIGKISRLIRQQLDS